MVVGARSLSLSGVASQGLFAHDNTHHTMGMAYALVDCLGAAGVFDRDGWARARKGFEANVVED